jgi:hypothetical protein
MCVRDIEYDYKSGLCFTAGQFSENGVIYLSLHIKSEMFRSISNFTPVAYDIAAVT